MEKDCINTCVTRAIVDFSALLLRLSGDTSGSHIPLLRQPSYVEFRHAADQVTVQVPFDLEAWTGSQGAACF